MVIHNSEDNLPVRCKDVKSTYLCIPHAHTYSVTDQAGACVCFDHTVLRNLQCCYDAIIFQGESTLCEHTYIETSTRK